MPSLDKEWYLNSPCGTVVLITFVKSKPLVCQLLKPVEILVMAAVFVPFSALVMNAFSGDSEDDFDFL